MSQIRDRLNSSPGKSRLPENHGIDPAVHENILVVQSAHPDRVLQVLQALAGKSVFTNPRYTLLCRNEPVILECFKNHPMLAGIRCHSGIRSAMSSLRSLRREKYDGAVILFTREPEHWKIKIFVFLLGIRNKLIFNEAGDCFYFTWWQASALVWHRVKQRLATTGRHSLDQVRTLLGLPLSVQRRPAPESYPGERILVVQSADASGVLRALDRLRQAPLFANPRYTVFCRDLPETVTKFQHHSMVYETRLHTRTHNSWGHLRLLRRQHYDAVVLFLTGEPGYWKIKCFAFLLGAKHKVVFNENNDCFYFQWKAWSRLLSHRMASRSGISAHAGWKTQVAGLLLKLIKLLCFPFRFVWLLMIWMQLRVSARKVSP
jgi:ADP-heptose:LPS heptosyltransferase